MEEFERNKLLQERAGELEYYNLWSFWDGISKSQQNQIIDDFEIMPSMWDYKVLFKGYLENCHVSRGPIDALSNLMPNARNDKSIDIQHIDYFFSKFKEYNPNNYIQNSRWGSEWENTLKGIIELMIESKKTDDEDDYQSSFDKQKFIERLKITTHEDAYWCSSYFFVMEYSKLVYKCYLNGRCNIDRFLSAVDFTLVNLDNLKLAVTKILDLGTETLHNGVIEQYLIYLEKQKMYIECRDIIIQLKDKGWNNDFDKRLTRCLKKINK
jgi:hypothetical protein